MAHSGSGLYWDASKCRNRRPVSCERDNESEILDERALTEGTMLSYSCAIPMYSNRGQRASCRPDKHLSSLVVEHVDVVRLDQRAGLLQIQ